MWLKLYQMKNRKPKADGRYVVNVSFTANETSLLSWADKHGNFSTYVKKLIEADMNNQEMTKAIPADMFQNMLLKMMGSSNLNNVFQNNIGAEVSVELENEKEQEPQKEEKKKLNKSAIGSIMSKKK